MLPQASRSGRNETMDKSATQPQLLILSFLALVLFFSTSSSAQVPAAPKPTPTPAAKPTPAPSPVTGGKATPLPQATPVAQTLDELRAKIRASLSRPELRRGRVGIKVVSLNSGKVVFEQDADQYFMPASNMKNFTVAAAMEKLTPDFKFVTSVYANSPPDANGLVKGDLRIYGRGDVSISTAFNEGDYFKGLDNLVDRIAAAGVKRVEGDLVGDESYFKGNAIPGTWEYDDLQWYYGAEMSALPLNDNAVDLIIKPGPAGYGCSVVVLPRNSIFRVNNRCTTTTAGIQRTLQINKQPGQNVLDITGTLPVGDAGFNGSITVSHPGELFIALLKQRLLEKGVIVTGQTRTINVRAIPTASAAPAEIAKLESPPFSVIAAKTMKLSQNLYTETILWTLGEQLREQDQKDAALRGSGPVYERADSGDNGLTVTRNFRTQIGIPDDAVVQYDGSGLSRHDLITPSAVVQLYTYMARQSRFAQAWKDSLTIAGVDGTLRNRFKGTAASGNVRGKTGTIDQVSALSGYMTTAAGEPLVFSIIVNGVPEGRNRTAPMDEIVVNLASFNGRID